MDRLELARALAAPPQGGGAFPPPGRNPLPVVVREREPARFMAAFSAAVAFGGDVFLADPSWGAAERAGLERLVQADGGPDGPAASKRMASRPVPSLDGGGGWLMIPCGGTTGALRFARHDEATISAAVRGFAECFGVERVNSVGVLPHHHVSGLMAWMRAALTGGTHLPWDWKRLEAGVLPNLAAGSWFLSLVPTQLQRLLGSPAAVAWLRGFRAILVGGGPVWPALSSAAAAARLPLSLTYGATETAAMATALPPEEFLAGGRSSGVALPHARIRLAKDGVICVAGESIFRGYYPDWDAGAPASRREFVTGDLGRLDERGRLTVVGRNDAVIITGGEKVDPQEVEAALWASGEYSDVAVIGIPDPEWGEVVVACYPAGEAPPDLSREAARGCDLAAYKRPRKFFAVADWPRNAQGKVNRAALRAAIRV